LWAQRKTCGCCTAARQRRVFKPNAPAPGEIR
jgi:hypothetical protein